MESLIVNFFGGPCSGKSTMAAHVFAELKWRKIDCELVAEYAKGKVWEKSLHLLNNQRLVYGKQYNMVLRAAENIDLVICDSPLFLSAIYAKETDDNLISMIINDFKSFNNINIFLLRNESCYNKNGRLQDLDAAIEIDNKIMGMLLRHNIEFTPVQSLRENVPVLVNKIISSHGRLNEK